MVAGIPTKGREPMAHPGRAHYTHRLASPPPRFLAHLGAASGAWRAPNPQINEFTAVGNILRILTRALPAAFETELPPTVLVPGAPALWHVGSVCIVGHPIAV